MREFFVGVGAGLLASVIFSLLLYIRTVGSLRWEDLRQLWSVTRRMRLNGIVNFFSSRAEYIQYRKQGTISQYIRTAQRELLYVGFWLAHGTEMSNVGAALHELIQNGVTVELVFIDPDSECLSAMAVYFDISVGEVKDRVNSTIEKMRRIRDSLDADARPRFILKTHQKLLTASAFLIDSRTPAARILVDFKLFAFERDHSFGIEFGHVASGDTLYSRIGDSFRKIRASSLEIPASKRQ